MFFSILTVVVIVPVRLIIDDRHETIKREPTMFLEFLMAWIYNIGTVFFANRYGFQVLENYDHNIEMKN